jgi:O-antigen/teichoic acid export membrane protein
MALDIAKRSVRGSLILFATNLTATLINLVSLILIARLLGPEGYGTYSLALLVPGLLQLFVGFGALPAVTRYAAYYTAAGRPEEAKRFTLNAIIFIGMTGAILTVLCFVLAGSLSASVLQRPSLGPYVQLASLAVLGTTALQAATLASIGWGLMKLSGSAVVSQAVMRLALSPALIILGLGVTGAIIGQVSSLFFAGVAGVSVLYLWRLRNVGGIRNFVADVKEMNTYGLPAYAGGVIAGLASYFVLFLLASIANDTVYGYYQAAINFTSPITLGSTSVVSALFPAFASIDGVKGDVGQTFRHAYKFVAFLLAPLVLFLIASAGPLVDLVYGANYSASIPYLQLLAFAYLPIAFGYSVHPAFFNGFGRTRLTFWLYLAASAAVFIAAPLLAISLGLGVDGLIYATFLSYFVAWAVGTFMANRFMHVSLEVLPTVSILLVSIVAFLGTSLLPAGGSAIGSLVLNAVFFFGVYITLAPLARAVNNGDLDLLEVTMSEPALLGRITAPLLRYERFLADLVRPCR